MLMMVSGTHSNLTTQTSLARFIVFVYAVVHPPTQCPTMNILSLRVSTMRGNENLKKNSEVRMERLQVSEELLDKFKDDPGT